MHRLLSYNTFSRVVLLIVLASLIVACSEGNVDAEPLSQQEADGKRIFRGSCSSCHSTSGETVIVGPSLAGIATRAATQEEGLNAHEYILSSIMKPDVYIVEGYKSGVMPSDYGLKLSGEEVDNLVRYLETLK